MIGGEMLDRVKEENPRIASYVNKDFLMQNGFKR